MPHLTPGEREIENMCACSNVWKIIFYFYFSKLKGQRKKRERDPGTVVNSLRFPAVYMCLSKSGHLFLAMSKPVVFFFYFSPFNSAQAKSRFLFWFFFFFISSKVYRSENCVSFKNASFLLFLCVRSFLSWKLSRKWSQCPRTRSISCASLNES